MWGTSCQNNRPSVSSAYRKRRLKEVEVGFALLLNSHQQQVLKQTHRLEDGCLNDAKVSSAGISGESPTDDVYLHIARYLYYYYYYYFDVTFSQLLNTFKYDVIDNFCRILRVGFKILIVVFVL